MPWIFAALAAAVGVNLVAKAASQLQFNAWPIWVTLAASGLAWLGAAIYWRPALAAFGAPQLATIGLFAAVQFAASYATRLAFGPINTLAGPFAVYITGLGDEGLRCMLLGALVALVPRPGTFALSSLAIFLINSLTSGFLGLDGIVFVTVTILLGEGALAVLGVTRGHAARQPAVKPKPSLVLLAGAAIGVSNGVKMLLQFQLNGVLYRFYFDDWYVYSVSAVALAYGAAGAAIGTFLGFRLRRTAP